MKLFGIVFIAFILTGCGGAASSGRAPSGDPRVVAVQKALDASRRARVPVIKGDVCADYPSEYAAIEKSVAPYRKLAQVHVSALHTVHIGRAITHCWTVSWATGTDIEQIGQLNPSFVRVGRMVVDKVGDDQQQMGMTVAPYRAHFEPNALEKSLAKAGILKTVDAPKDIPDGQAVMHKDADGNWVAQL